MFNDKYGLTKAVLDGRKTMTRRLVPIKEAKRIESFFDSDDWDYAKQTCIDDSAAYMIGETIAVAQSYKDLGYTKEWVEQHISPNPNANWNDPFEKKYPGWNNKMFTHSELKKVRKIEITNIKVERLQDISDEDCMCEGVTWDYDDYPIMRRKVYLINDYEAFLSPSLAFAALINRICGKSTWELNPYVFAYTFELVK